METNQVFLDFLNRCVNKEKESWDHFVEQYSRLIYNYIIKTLKKYYYFFQNDEVEEIFNRIFVALLEKDCRRLRNFRGQNERSFGAYLREISFHITVDFLREQRSTVELDQVTHKVFDEDKSKRINYYDLKKMIEMIKVDLPERHQYLFRMLYEEGLNLADIAEILDLKLNAVHQLKFRMINNIIKIAKRKKIYEELKIFISDS